MAGVLAGRRRSAARAESELDRTAGERDRSGIVSRQRRGVAARRSDVDAHLFFVAEKQGFPVNFEGNWSWTLVDGDPLDAPPTKADVELVAFLLLGRDPLLAETVQLLRRHRSLRSLVMASIEE